MNSSISSSDPEEHRAQTSLLVGFAAYLIGALVVFVGASELLVRSQVLPRDTQAAHFSLLEAADTPDAAFGDSHVARGFAPPVSMVNLGYPSENLDMIITKIARYYATLKPGRVILQADPHQFSSYRLYAPVTTLLRSAPAPILHITSPRHRVRLLAYWDAALQNGGTLASKVKMTANGALLSEGDFSAEPPRKRDLEARQRLLTHQLAPPGSRADAQTRYAALLDDLTAKGARICLVTFPVTAAYREAEAGQHAEAVSFFAAQAARVQARYVDARAMIRDPSLFRDVDHLNPAGAELFATRIMRDCFPN